MLKDHLFNIFQNKNLLMLFTVIVYILAISSVFMEITFFVSLSISLFFIVCFIKKYVNFKYLLIWILIFYFGIFNTNLRLRDADELLNIAPINSTISGQIISIPKIKSKDKQSFFFKVAKIENEDFVKVFKDEKVLVTLNSPDKYKIYDYYSINGRLSVPFKYGNSSQFDYANYLKNYNVYALFYGSKDIKPTKIEGFVSKKEKLLQGINDYREKIIDVHSKYLKSPNLEILGGIVFGDDAISPNEEIKQSFINSGLLHILAASGMNVAFIFSFFYLLLSALRVNYKVNISIGIVMVIIYSLMTGLGASIIRATCMLIFVLIGKLLDRDAHSISLLAFVAFIMLIYNPMYLNDVSFQLSFIVTFGLLLMTPLIMKRDSKLINWCIGTIFIPIIAQIWVIPIQIFYFNNISLYSVFANIMSVPLLSVISFGGFISSLFVPILPNILCQSFDFILNPLITLLLNISNFWGNLPFASLQTTHPSAFQICLYYVILLLFVAILKKDIREKYFKYLMSLIIILIITILVTIIPFNNKNLEITSFDVGNADAFLLKTPENKYIIIDTAKSGYNGGKSQAQILILKYLIDKGIKEVESIIVTHFDSDHCGGAADLLRGVRVKNIYVNSLDNDSILAKEIYKEAKDHGVNIILAKSGQKVYDVNNLFLTNYIAPDSNGLGDNEASINTLLIYNDFSMLFTGDSGFQTFDKIKNNIPNNITVLKVGHHGANTSISKDMINYLKPKYALISVGNNIFGHPTLYTIELLKKQKILRTDIHNSIKIVINKKGYKVYTYDINKKKYLQYD